MSPIQRTLQPQIPRTVLPKETPFSDIASDHLEGVVVLLIVLAVTAINGYKYIAWKLKH